MSQLETEDRAFSDSARAFLEIGRERNRLVHQNFAAFTLEKSSNELYELYRKAYHFVCRFPEELRKYAKLPYNSEDIDVDPVNEQEDSLYLHT